ncbi:MAG: metallophosphatase [Paludibacteraceae bacterium]|nr:metallophosphatase [Paludibacteraceae bacterium]
MKKILLFISVLSLCMCTHKPTTLTILHTNDTHSQVLPKDNGQGGYARRMGYIAQERSKDPNLLLLDAGDFSQGTTFFNFFHGRMEVDALNRMGYDVVCLGNHELDNGVDTLAAILKDARFEVVCANYDVQGSALEGIVKPYTILHRNGLKIGVFGIGCTPNGMIDAARFAPLTYLPPYETAQRIATLLKKRKHCDVVICLSHQGTQASSEGDCNDEELIANTRDIDLVVGGHTHKVYDNFRVTNLDGQDIPLVQAGKSGVKIGKIILKTGTF